LLPTTGPLAAAGHAVRNGFIAANYHSGAQHRLNIYDTASTSIQALYRQAREDCAELVVGPLQKTHLQELSQLPDLDLPVLALNSVAELDDVQVPFLQYALAVEDDVRALASRLKSLQHERLVLLYTQDAWSQRAARALQEQLSDEQVVSQTQLSSSKEITAKIADVFRVSQSISRREALEKVLRQPTEYTPRTRRDIEAVVALVDGLKASALNSALNYHFADSTPVYATSQVLQKIDADDMDELESIQFADIPWNLSQTPIKQEIEHSFGPLNRNVHPLYAFGVDAFRIADRFDLMLAHPAHRLHGATGYLKISPSRIIERELDWAIIRDAKPYVIK